MPLTKVTGEALLNLYSPLYTFKTQVAVSPLNHSRTALHLACAKAHKEIIIHLCALHADVNVQDADGSTPMHKVPTHKMRSEML